MTMPTQMSAPVLGHEMMARTLTETGNYRITRRFEPRTTWSGTSVGQTRTALIVDVETTGLNHEVDRIIQLAICRIRYLEDGTVVDAEPCRTWYEDPGVPLSPEIVALTGITDARIAGHRIPDEEVEQLLEGAVLVIAHNARFDRPFLDARLPAFQRMAWACTWQDVNWRDEGFRSSSLEWLADRLLGLFYGAHDATEDTGVLVELLCARLPVSQRTVMAALRDTALKPRAIIVATGAPFEKKEKLKQRGYRWEPRGPEKKQLWCTSLSIVEVDAELGWLAENVYEGRGGPEVRRVRYTDRFSVRA